MWRKTIPLLALAALPALSLARPAEEMLKDKDHKKLGQQVADYFEAKSKSSGISEAFGELLAELEKIEKKMKGPSVLSLTEDWEKVFWYARLERYDTKGLKKGKIEDRTMEDSSLSYAVYLPSKYSTKEDPYPVIISVPPPGVSPEAHLEEAWTDAARDGCILIAPAMPDDPAKLVELGSSGDPGGIWNVMVCFGQSLKEFAIDVNRVFLVGHGKGGDAALATGQAYPHLFAGVAALGELGTTHDATNFRNSSVLIAGGGAAGDALVDQAKSLQYDSVTRLDSGGEAEFWAWMSEQKRDPYPTEIKFSPTRNFMRSAYWLGADGVEYENDPMLSARVDRGTNTITIDVERISTVMLFFNDLLLDLDAPVQVVINGTPNEISVKRNQRVMLDLAYSQGDGRVFTNFQAFDVPSQ